MNYTINDRLNFHHVVGAYEDKQGRDICGCCGTHFVVSVGELEEVKEIVSDMYEALKAAFEKSHNPEVEIILMKALAKVEGGN